MESLNPPYNSTLLGPVEASVIGLAKFRPMEQIAIEHIEMEGCHIKRLTIECATFHVTGNIYSLVHSSSQISMMIALDGAHTINAIMHVHTVVTAITNEIFLLYHGNMYIRSFGPRIYTYNSVKLWL